MKNYGPPVRIVCVESFLVGIFGEQFEKKAVLTRERWRLKKLYLYGKFFARGGGGPFAQKIIASAPNFYKRVEKKRGPYCNNIGRTGV